MIHVFHVVMRALCLKRFAPARVFAYVQGVQMGDLALRVSCAR